MKHPSDEVKLDSVKVISRSMRRTGDQLLTMCKTHDDLIMRIYGTVLLMSADVVEYAMRGELNDAEAELSNIHQKVADILRTQRQNYASIKRMTATAPDPQPHIQS